MTELRSGRHVRSETAADDKRDDQEKLMEKQDKIEIELATGAQLYRMNQLGILPEQSQITKQKASAVLTQARLTGKWPKDRPEIGRPYDGTWVRRSKPRVDA